MFLTVLNCGLTFGQKGRGNTLPAIPTLTVCEALSHASEYNGKMVQIRDRMVGTDEGAGFFGESCPGVFVTEGKVWPSAIAWASPNESILHRVDFSFDWESSKKLHEKWHRLRKRLPDRCIAVHTRGCLKAGRRKEQVDGSRGTVVRIPGFGHLNGAPAQLVLKSADAVEEIPDCARPK